MKLSIILDLILVTEVIVICRTNLVFATNYRRNLRVRSPSRIPRRSYSCLQSGPPPRRKETAHSSSKLLEFSRRARG